MSTSSGNHVILKQPLDYLFSSES